MPDFCRTEVPISLLAVNGGLSLAPEPSPWALLMGPYISESATVYGILLTTGISDFPSC